MHAQPCDVAMHCRTQTLGERLGETRAVPRIARETKENEKMLEEGNHAANIATSIKSEIGRVMRLQSSAERRVPRSRVRREAQASADSAMAAVS